MAVPNPLAQAMIARNHITPEQAELGSITSTVADTIKKVGDVATARVGADTLNSLLHPRQPDPAESLEKTAKAFTAIAGLASPEERRREQERREDERREDRERREERERAEREEKRDLEREKLEAAKMQHAETTQMQLAKMQMDAYANLMTQMANQQKEMALMLEKINNPDRHKPQPSEFEKKVLEVGMDVMLNRPSLVEEFEHMKHNAQVLGFAPPSAVAHGPTEPELRLKEKELDWRMEESRMNIDAKKEEARSRNEVMKTGFQAVTGLIGAFFATRTGGSPPGASGQTADLDLFVCPNPECGHRMAISKGAASVTCPNCGQEAGREQA